VFAVSISANVWQYNVAAGGSWSRVGSFPENTPAESVTFSINGMGYCIGNGHCWQFDPASTQWTRKNDPPGGLSAPLVIGDKAYLRSDSNHLFAYEPITDTYTQQKDPPDFGNYNYWSLAGYFVINEQGYYIGYNGACWKYDASIDYWQRRASFTGMDKVYPRASFSADNAGYILGNDAYDNVGHLNLWRYDAALNLWTKTNDYYPSYGWHQVKAVSLDSFACIGLGYNEGGDFWVTDFWRYK